MVNGNGCLQKRIVWFLFFTALVVFIYVHNSPNRSINSFLVIDESEATNVSTETVRLPKIETTSNLSLIVVVQVHNRLSYLKQLISSLSSSRYINRVLLIFSHDYIDEDLNRLINNITFCQHKQIFFPPTTSNYTNSSIVNKESEVKLHWWWKANEAFRIASEYKYDGSVLFLEEDHFVAEDFIHVLNMLQDISQNYCINCVYSLSGDTRNFRTENNKFKTSTMMSNMGLAFNSTTWFTIKACAEKFCRYNDYNWDWTINYIFQECVEPRPKTLIMTGSRVFHTGKCGMHFNNKDCDATTLVKEIQDDINKHSVLLYPKKLEYIGEIRKSRIVKGFGGFGDKRDQQLCLDFSSNITFVT